MAILGLQGVRGGVGTTSLTAALAWALQILGENVLVIDASPDNLLRMSFKRRLRPSGRLGAIVAGRPGLARCRITLYLAA